MALRELKVCLLGVSAPRPALRGALARAGGGGREGGRESAEARKALCGGGGEPPPEPWRGSECGGPLPGRRVGLTPAGAAGAPRLPGPVPLRRPGGRKGLPLHGGRRSPELSMAAFYFPVFSFKKRKEKKHKHSLRAFLLLTSCFGLGVH